MDIQKIQDIVNLVAHSQVAEVQVTLPSGHIRIKNKSNHQADIDKPSNLLTTSTNTPSSNLSAATTQSAVGLVSDKQLVIQSKHIGKFKLADDAISEPLIKVGDSIKVGDTIGYVASLAQLHPIIADKAGVVREILLEQNAPVEYSTAIVALSNS